MSCMIKSDKLHKARTRTSSRERSSVISPRAIPAKHTPWKRCFVNLNLLSPYSPGSGVFPFSGVSPNSGAFAFSIFASN